MRRTASMLDLDEDEEEDLFDLVGLEPQSPCEHVATPTSPTVTNDTGHIQEILAMSVQEFYRRYLSQSSDFWEQACKACECTEVKKSIWSHQGCHQERKLEFKIPVKHLLGPRETAVTQTQRISVLDDSTILFQTSSISHDVLYSDSFELRSNWKISSERQGQAMRCWLLISWEVDWKRNVWIKSVIERNALQGAKEFFEQSIQLAKHLLLQESSFEDVRQESRLTSEPINMTPEHKHSQDDRIDDFNFSPPNPASPLRALEAKPTVSAGASRRPPSRSSLRRSKHRRRVSLSTSALHRSTSAQPHGRDFPLWPFLGLLVVVLVGVSVPFYWLWVQVPDLSPVLAEHQVEAERLESRLHFLQNLVGQLSRNITQVPGKLVKEQWERHWAAQQDPELWGLVDGSEDGSSSSLLGWAGTLFVALCYRLLQVSLLTVLVSLVFLTGLSVTQPSRG